MLEEDIHMKILLDDVKLNLLLEQKKQFIGKTVVWDSVLSAVSFLISVILASYGDFFMVPGIVIKTVFVILGLFFTGKSIFDIYKSSKNSYTYEDLFKDINRLNEITHNHSIVAVKNTFDEFPNKFLVYYDTRWNAYLFLNFKDNTNNESFIISGVSNKLKIKKEDIKVSYIAQNVNEKRSESHHENRIYSHKLYLASVARFPDVAKQNAFEIDGVQYCWMSISEMENDHRIMEVNADIVQFVKDNCN